MDFLDDMQLDVLKEIGNIGAGNAATSLSKLMNRRIDMNVPAVRVMDFDQIEKIVGGAESLVAGVYLEFTGDIQGTIIFILDKDSTFNLLSFVIPNYKLNHNENLSPLEVSALKEIGNILTGSYLGSLASLTGLNVKPSIPELAYDMAAAILSVPMIKFGQTGDQALFIETIFIDGLDQVKGYFFLMPDVDSYKVILKSLGVVR